MPDAGLGLQVFLMRKREVLKNHRLVLLVDRDKNRDAMEHYGLSFEGICKRLAKLGSEHYWKGPERDDDGSEGSLWFFFYDEFGTRFYIKLKLFQMGGSDWLKVLSYHD